MQISIPESFPGRTPVRVRRQEDRAEREVSWMRCGWGSMVWSSETLAPLEDPSPWSGTGGEGKDPWPWSGTGGEAFGRAPFPWW